RYTANMSKAKRTGKIYVDYLRNARGATFIVPFSTRARASAPVSMPLDWHALDESVDPAQWTIANALDWIRERPDPWKDFFSVRQSLASALKKLSA
ncbi:MAG: hypothetical protein SGI88_06815, partial [Candidatus Hydrogenedentes bacterium]|nr:hypothetical protein [Candidatus Hydrogenedentota bacterium]